METVLDVSSGHNYWYFESGLFLDLRVHGTIFTHYKMDIAKA